jgi:hypothetical protein
MTISGSANRSPGIIAPLAECDETNTGRTRTKTRYPACMKGDPAVDSYRDVSR